MPRLIRFIYAHLRHFLGRMAPASSAQDRASALRDVGPGAPESSVHFITYIIVFALIFAAVGGDGLFLARRRQSRLDISAASFSLTDSSLTYCSVTGADCSVTDIRWPIEGSSGWSPSIQKDHAELVASEQEQREAACSRGRGLIRRSLTAHFDSRTHRRKQCISVLIPPRRSTCSRGRGLIRRSLTAHFDSRTHRRKQCISVLIPPRRSIVELVLQPELSLNVSATEALPYQQAFLYSLPRSATRFDQDDAVGLAAERAFDDHLLEKRCLLTEAVSRESKCTAPALACERCGAESVLDCLCGSEALTSSPAAGGCQCCSSFAQPMLLFHCRSAGLQRCDYCVKLKASKDCAARRAQHDTSMKRILQNFSDAIHEMLQKIPDCIHEFSVQAEQRRQVIIRHGTGAYAIHSLDELSRLKQQAARNASKATGLSNLSVHLVFNGKPVYYEGAIFDGSATNLSCNTYSCTHGREWKRCR